MHVCSQDVQAPSDSAWNADLARQLPALAVCALRHVAEAASRHTAASQALTADGALARAYALVPTSAFTRAAGGGGNGRRGALMLNFAGMDIDYSLLERAICAEPIVPVLWCEPPPRRAGAPPAPAPPAPPAPGLDDLREGQSEVEGKGAEEAARGDVPSEAGDSHVRGDVRAAIGIGCDGAARAAPPAAAGAASAASAAEALASAASADLPAGHHLRLRPGCGRGAVDAESTSSVASVAAQPSSAAAAARASRLPCCAAWRCRLPPRSFGLAGASTAAHDSATSAPHSEARALGLTVSCTSPSAIRPTRMVQATRLPSSAAA